MRLQLLTNFLGLLLFKRQLPDQKTEERKIWSDHLQWHGGRYVAEKEVVKLKEKLKI